MGQVNKKTAAEPALITKNAHPEGLKKKKRKQRGGKGFA